MPRGKQGFTLLELMMVVVIIGILATIALPQYFNSAEKSRAAEAFQMLGTIRTSEMRYKAQNASGVWTILLTDLDVTIPDPGTNWDYAAAAAVGPDTTSNATATRLGTGGVCSGAVLNIDLTNGALCMTSGSCQVLLGVQSGTC